MIGSICHEATPAQHQHMQLPFLWQQRYVHLHIFRGFKFA
jgi:hypothetical protein